MRALFLTLSLAALPVPAACQAQAPARSYGGDTLAVARFDRGEPLTVTASDQPFVSPWRRHRTCDSCGKDGSGGLEVFWAPGSPDYSPVWLGFPATGHVIVEADFRQTAPYGNTASGVKVLRFSNPNGGVLGRHANGSFNWGWDDWGGGKPIAAVSIGVFDQAVPQDFLRNVGGRYVYGANIADGQWHHIKIEADFSGNPLWARFWFDGKPVVMPAGLAWSGDGYRDKFNRWSGGQTGVTPSTLSLPRFSERPLPANLGIVEQHSGGFHNTGSVFWDNIVVLRGEGR